MKVGLKVGPQNWQAVLTQVSPECCEVWFRLDWKNQYQELFATLQEKNIPFGLHFWAMLEGNIEPNIAYPHANMAEQAAELMRQNIEIAAAVGAHYVNIHPGGLRVKKTDLDSGTVEIAQLPEIDESTALQTLLTYLPQLHSFAKDKGVLFLVETLPQKDPSNIHDYQARLNPVDVKAVSAKISLELVKNGLSITNDFSHTAMGFGESDPEVLWHKLLNFTQQTAYATRLLHINTIAPPLNGTDSHDGNTEADFAKGNFPSRSQVLELLSLFKNRDDVWAIPEPQIATMIENYRALQTLIAEG